VNTIDADEVYRIEYSDLLAPGGKAMANSPILDELIAQEFIDIPTAERMLRESDELKIPVLRHIVDEEIVTEDRVYRIVADIAKMALLSPEDISVDPSAMSKLTGDRAKRLHALPYAWQGSKLLVAVDDPTNLNLADDLLKLTGCEVQLFIAPPSALKRKIAQVYRAEDELDDLTDALNADTVSDLSVDSSSAADGGATGEAPIVRWVNLVISQAVEDRASDIHIEPYEYKVVVRYRIDGVLHHRREDSRQILNSVVSRIKIMSNMDISERRKPQDGRMTVTLKDKRRIDLRVVSLPTVYGEKVVMRILDNSSAPLELAQVGLSQYHIDKYAKHYTKPHGMILVTGPTGSGKSTTLYATLNSVRDVTVNVITVEDPVEYRMDGLSQIQINNKAGLTFSAALRSILRADPDVILVGEIRDQETAKIAIEASLTGHLVLTTLHTNDAASAVTRLVEMGIEPFLVGSALSLVVAQRLLRKLCEKCAIEYSPEPHDLLTLEFPWKEGDPLPVIRKAVGCTFCGKTGYKGRSAIHEMLEVDSLIERMANDGAHTDQIRDAAIEHGHMLTIRKDGWQKVLAGITTIDEVLRVTL
jgi:type IV pilus assembly protein PilB